MPHASANAPAQPTRSPSRRHASSAVTTGTRFCSVVASASGRRRATGSRTPGPRSRAGRGTAGRARRVPHGESPARRTSANDSTSVISGAREHDLAGRQLAGGELHAHGHHGEAERAQGHVAGGSRAHRDYDARTAWSVARLGRTQPWRRAADNAGMDASVRRAASGVTRAGSRWRSGWWEARLAG